MPNKPPLDSFLVKPSLDSFLLPATKQEDDLSYLQRVGKEYEQAGAEITSTLQQPGAYPGQNVLRSFGAVAGATFAPIMEIPFVKKATEKIVGKVVESPKIQPFIRSVVDLATKHPETAKDLRAVFDIATLGVGSGVAKEGKLIASDIARATEVALTPSEQVIQNQIINLFNKSIKPGKKSLALGKKYEDSTLNALKTIKANSDNLNIEDAFGEITARTPQTINELNQAVKQTKEIVFKQYDDLAKKAGKQGVFIDTKPVASELDKVINNKALRLVSPEVIKYAETWAERLKELGVMDTETAQEAIKLMNKNLEAFYRNPTYDSASKVAIDAGIANNFRRSLDSAIEGATGEQYQVLKNQYSALKAIENDVINASAREAKKNIKGLLDYTDIFTGGQMISGILSLNPAMFTKGALERGIKEYIKFLNDPNRAIGNIFEKLP